MSVTWSKLDALDSLTPTVDDLVPTLDTSNPAILKKTTWQLVRDLFKTYFDTIYASLSGATFTWAISAINLSGTNTWDNAANSNSWLVHTIWDETIGGNKTFSNNIYASGNVGIRNTNPQNNLSIGSNIWTFDWIWIWKSDGNIDIRIWQLWSNNLIFGWKYNSNASLAYSIIETYASNNPIKIWASDLYVNDQNWTGAWTSFTPTLSWDSWSWITYDVQYGRYKQIGKIVHFEFVIRITGKWTMSGNVYMQKPLDSIWYSYSRPLAWFCGQEWAPLSAIKGMPCNYNATTMFMKVISAAWNSPLQWSDVAANDVFKASWTYETA